MTAVDDCHEWLLAVAANAVRPANNAASNAEICERRDLRASTMPSNAKERRATPRNAEQRQGTPSNAKERRATPRNAQQRQGTPSNAEPANAEPNDKNCDLTC